ncbi:MAG: NAD-dependent epimerase/dehydratase family protein, partial [Acidimicrobiales bacterium]
MDVVVTGGAGFIGANLCRLFDVSDGVTRVVAVDDLSTGDRDNLVGLAKVHLVEGSILDAELLDSVVEGA